MIKYMPKYMMEIVTEIQLFNRDGVAYGVGECTVKCTGRVGGAGWCNGKCDGRSV